MFSHSDYKYPYEPPLSPTIRIQRPYWVPCYKEYNGRPEWWAELGYKDEMLRRGMSRGIRYDYRERDNYWYDPKVPDGTSVVGPFGLDTQYHRNLIKKGDQPMTFDEHQKKITESSGQYKNILNNFDISPEHPGFALSPLLDKYKEEYRTLGTHFKLHNFMQTHRGPRFWDKPMNEGCIEKGLALVKYIAVATYAVAFMNRGKTDLKVLVNWKGIFKDWAFRFFPIPAALGMTFGVTACTSAKIRHIDDTWNWTIASVVVGALHATMRDFKLQRAVATTVPLIALSSYYQHVRTIQWGTQGMPFSRMYSGHFSPYTGPLGWKTFHVTPVDLTRLNYVPDAWKYCSR
uniref:Uncharacterized protein n=1 Tax=Meloidogyne javanica TaxID=6303 RepID=A0A915NEY2_MELJA